MPDDGILMVGTGGHARQWVAWLQATGALATQPLVWLEQPEYDGPETLLGYPVLRQGCSLHQHWPRVADYVAYFGIGCVRSAPWRGEVYRHLSQELGLQFGSWVHPSAIVAPDVVMSPGCYVGPLAVVQPGVTLGAACLINTAAVVEHGATLGENIHVAPNATICGDVTVGADSFIGANAIVKQGLVLPPQTTVAAGSFIAK